MNARVLYNEIDPFAAAWLRQLIAAGSIPAGDVDERDIRDLLPSDLDGYNHVHFFGGIGGWALALRLADWPDDRPCWTGSCPCQPFSAAGRGSGFADERHLWPAWFHLIRECQPAIVFGEQVEAAVRHGWLDLVQADLEGEGYAFGTEVLGAHSVGAPHIRQRLWWVAHADLQHQGSARQHATRAGNACGQGEANRVADSLGPRLERGDARTLGGEREAAERGGAIGNPWSDIEWLPCRDGKTRPAQPGIFPLASRLPNRVGTLRGAGNAIVPQVAAEFMRAASLRDIYGVRL